MLSGFALSPGCSANTDMLGKLLRTCQATNRLERMVHYCGWKPPVAHRIELVAAGLRAVCLGMCHAICEAGQQDQQNGNLHDPARPRIGRRGRGESCSQAASAVACQLNADQAGLRGLKQQLCRQQLDPGGVAQSNSRILPLCLTQVNCKLFIKWVPCTFIVVV